jgi:ComF family protein
MAGVWRAAGRRADLIVPVPLHASRAAERGYNQAALLAHALASCLELPVQEAAVIRVRATASQIHLNPAERRANVRDAFQCREDVNGLRILLIDDVCTTGATLEACAAALRACGAASVFGLTAARALP